jgi:hypothetical protein
MKTDDYKQEFSISATPSSYKNKKNIFAFKKSAIAARKFLKFFRVAAGDAQTRDRKSLVRGIAPKKALRLKSRLDRMTTLL